MLIQPITQFNEGAVLTFLEFHQSRLLFSVIENQLRRRTRPENTCLGAATPIIKTVHLLRGLLYVGRRGGLDEPKPRTLNI